MKQPSPVAVRYVFAAVVAAWLAISIPGMAARTGDVLANLAQGFRRSDEGNREALHGDFYRFLEKCRREIPADATLFMATDDFYFYYFGSYYLYPRRVLVSSPDRRVDGLAGFPQFHPTPDFVKANGITFVVDACRTGEFRIRRTD